MSSPTQPNGPDPPPLPGPSNSGGGGGKNANPQSAASASNLYLVTFLATLFLLLFISCAIILRSYILRRRYQRNVQGAIGAGMLLTPRSQGSRHGRLGHVPKVFDSWITDGGGSGKWQNMRPVAAQPVFVKRKRRDSVNLKTAIAAVSQPATSTLESSSIQPSPSRVRSLFSRFRRPQDAATQSEGTEHAQYPLVPIPKSRVEMLQISVLVAMPSPNKAMRKNALVDSITTEDIDEAPLPELVLGITKVSYRHKTVDPQATPQPSSPPSDITIS